VIPRVDEIRELVGDMRNAVWLGKTAERKSLSLRLINDRLFKGHGDPLNPCRHQKSKSL